MAKRDYYEVLGVERAASDQEIKSAFRKLAHQFHPDKNPGDRQAEERFKEINEANEVLSDPQKRAQYDRFGHAGAQMPAGYGEPFGASMADIFGDFFGDMFGGRRGGRTSRRRGHDLRYNLEVSFEEAAFGTNATIRIPRHKTCEACGGSGARRGTSARRCSTCGGAGEVRFSQGFFSVARTCPACEGKGTVIPDPCPECRSAGRVVYQAAETIPVPAGVDDGARYRLAGRGDEGEDGGPPGDLYIHVSVKEHPLFTREESDVICELPISFTLAALGGKVEVPTLDGKVQMSIPAGTQSGKNFRLRNKGITRLGGVGRGDQIVQVTVEVPRHLTKKQRELVEQLAQSMGEAQHPRSRSFFDKVKELFGAEPGAEASDVESTG